MYFFLTVYHNLQNDYVLASTLYEDRQIINVNRISKFFSVKKKKEKIETKDKRQ